MNNHIDTTHQHLGELAVMSHQTQAAEQRILDEALAQLEKVQTDLKAAGPRAFTGDHDRYMGLITERGRLQLVIAQARQHLGTA